MRERLPVLIMKTKSGFELYTNQPTNQPEGGTSRVVPINLYREEEPTQHFTRPKYSKSSISNKVSRSSFVAREIIIIIIEPELCPRVSCRLSYLCSFVRSSFSALVVVISFTTYYHPCHI